MSMLHSDRWGAAVRAGGVASVARLDNAVEDLVALRDDPLAAADSAVGADTSLSLGHILRAYLCLYATSAEGMAAARGILAGLPPVEPGSRESLHLQAATHWASGEWPAAARSLEAALRLDGRDLLALKVAQDLYFFLGDRLDLRDVVARVLPQWPEDQPGWGYVQGMYAFGLEENAAYRQAEASAAAAMRADPGDVWAVHAQAHVFEMEGRQAEGIDFLTVTEGDWSSSFFAIHNWWHLSLHHLELGDIDTVVALYDQRIRAGRSDQWLDAVDAASLLWRLALAGADVASRAEELADDIERMLAAPVYAFNDWHAVMALGLAGRHARVAEVLHANRTQATGSNERNLARAGVALLDGFAAFAAGRPDRAIECLGDVRPRADAIGGSHAQRDVIDLTLLAAAARAGERALADALVAERVARKPTAAAAAAAVLAAGQRAAQRS